MCSRGTKHKPMQHNVTTVDAKVINPNGPYIFIQNSDAAYSSNKRQVVITDTKQTPKKSNSNSSTAQMNVPHTHGVPAGGAAGR